MTTGYALADTLPKDAAGRYFQALVDDTQSDNSFGLWKGIAASPFGTNARRLAHAAIATQTQGSGLKSGEPGVTLMAFHGSVVPYTGVEKAQFVQLNYGGLVTGNKDFQILASGSVAASADTLHSLFGTYNALSSLAASTIIHIQLLASAQNLRLFPDNVSNGPGVRYVAGNDYYVDLPGMMVFNASRLHFKNSTAGNNAEVNWVIWR